MAELEEDWDHERPAYTHVSVREGHLDIGEDPPFNHVQKQYSDPDAQCCTESTGQCTAPRLANQAKGPVPGRCQDAKDERAKYEEK